MSDEQQNNIPKNPEPSNTSSSSEEERKKQFEKMKDRFGKKSACGYDRGIGKRTTRWSGQVCLL